MMFAKFGTIIFVFIASLNASAWRVNLTNNTDGQISVTVTYAGPGVCAEETKTIEPKSSLFPSINTILCCTTGITVKGNSGKVLNKQAKTDISWTCANQDVNFNALDNGDIHIMYNSHL
jgi:hypothetical protein